MGIVIFSVQAAETLDFSTLPKTNKGEKWCIGYYEGGNYSNYYKYLTGTVQGLMDIGWIEKKELPSLPQALSGIRLNEDNCLY